MKSPESAVVVIDVLRAFTTASVAFERGAAAILLTADAEEAFRLKRARPELVLVGESEGDPIAGFDFSNSPTEMCTAVLAGATLVQKTTHGVPATLAALGNGRVFVTGLRTARATRAYLEGFAHVSRVCSDADGDDDQACADFLAGRIDLDEARRRVRASRAARKFLDPAKPGFPESDLTLSLAEAESPFVMEVFAGDLPRIEPLPCAGGRLVGAL
jgi:2-phosphosulfolactate phosphatase